ncbi:MAG: L-ribulose-5-phosphate 4-epimerase AraD [Verrucomicrobia bacterium]|nr:L-ribulose-5-phosphate 4-epimerase AraD [Verrucomicrobiota bacterium]MCH8525710.1 L-ribulose-5-phosphate 4-epimerase AraD [Kiritimatiellia bacterium]
MSTLTLRTECCEINRRLPATGLVDLTFGNVSVSDPDRGIFAIKPSGVPYADLRPEHIVVLDFDGNIIEGTLRPSSDEPTHRILLKAFTGIRSVVHTHSRNAVAFAQAGRPVPCLGTTHCDAFYGPVPVTRSLRPDEINGAYEHATGDLIVESFADRDPLQCPAVLVRHHGPFAWGPTAAKALENAHSLEIVADMALKTLALTPGIQEVDPCLLDKHFLRKHGPGAYYGQT